MKKYIMSLFCLISAISSANGDMPNAFHTDQLSSGAVATFMDSCQASMRNARPDVTTYTTLYICSCMGDWMRDHSGVLPSEDIRKLCVDWGIKQVNKIGKPVYRK